MKVPGSFLRASCRPRMWFLVALESRVALSRHPQPSSEWHDDTRNESTRILVSSARCGVQHHLRRRAARRVVALWAVTFPGSTWSLAVFFRRSRGHGADAPAVAATAPARG